MMLRFMAIVLFTAFVAPGCGDDDNIQTVQRRGGDPGEAEEEVIGDAVKPPKLTANESWDKLRAFFLGTEKDEGSGFVRKPVGTVRDPFEPQLVKFVPRIEIMDTASESGEAPEIAPELVEDSPTPVDLGPTQKYRTQEYRPLLIRWGSSVNKAVVSDPSGETFVVTKDMKLGSNNGRITEITQYEIWVQEDDKQEPIALSIEPDILRVGAVRDVERDDNILFPGN